MSELLANPLWRPDDLGRPIPDSPHAVSVCLPLWRDNTGYEEGEPRVIEALRAGYPRFVYNPLCRRLFNECEDRFAGPEENCLAFPSEAAAARFCDYLQAQAAASARVHPLGRHNVHAVSYAAQHAQTAKNCWQHCGEGVSSRLAQACTEDAAPTDGQAARLEIRRRVAAHADVDEDDVFLFPSGMNAVFWSHRMANAAVPDRRCAQFGFPYVDTLKIQEQLGKGVIFYSRGDEAELGQLAEALEGERLCGIFTEFPSNPLLACPDLERLAELSRRHETPLIVDETIATLVNASLLPAADALTTSLTKFFSGAGDVIAGAVILNPQSPWHAAFQEHLRAAGEDTLWGSDAEVLARNSRGFEERVREINERAEALTEFLRTQPLVAEVHYPKFTNRAHYDAFRRPDGGYSGLFSLTLVDEQTNAPRFFDALRCCKGPNLGTDYTLACPYTILAHYQELEWAEAHGVSRYLIRVSVGREPIDELLTRFGDALATLS